MSLQIFLQGKILGTDTFLVSGDHVAGRAWWASLLSEVLPRALLAELGLSSMLLGSSGGDQFLLLIPEEFRGPADDFCRAAAASVQERSSGLVRLVWAGTENLGSWSDIRQRLDDEMHQRIGAPVAQSPLAFQPYPPAANDSYFGEFERQLGDSEHVSWSPENPAELRASGGKHTWRLGDGREPDVISMTRHTAPGESADASLAELAERATGRKTWGVLRGDVDSFAARLRRAQSVEEHLQLSLMYKQFFAGELQMRCSLPEFWQKVTLLWSGGDDFALYGSWNALVGMAREIQRIFSIFVDANLKEYAGMEGKTISMAVALAREGEEDLRSVLAGAREKLEIAKSSGKDCIYLFGRTLEWKQLADAAGTRETMTRMIQGHGASPQFLHELASFYTEAERAGSGLLGGRGRNDRVDRPWRFHRRLNGVIGGSRDREFQRLKTELIADFTGRRAKQIRLRPQGRVALEWARLETEVS